MGLLPEVLPSSQRTLRNYRCLWKAEAGHLQVQIPVNEAGEPIVPISPKGISLELALLKTDRHLDFFTQLPDFSKRNAMLLAQGGPEAPLALQPAPRMDAGPSQGVFARMVCQVPDLPPTSWPIQITLPLQSSAATWKYFYIGEAHLPAPEVVDTTGTLSFEAIPGTDLNRDTEPLAAKLQARYPDAAHWLYRSTSPVTWREKRYPGIQLQRETNTIINNLRNPNWETQGIEIINALPNH